MHKGGPFTITHVIIVIVTALAYTLYQLWCEKNNKKPKAYAISIVFIAVYIVLTLCDNLTA